MTNQSPSSKLKLYLRIIVSLALLILCFTLISRDELIQSLAMVEPWYFLAALTLNAIGTILIKAWITYQTSSAVGIKIGFIELIKINFTARFYTLTLPRGASAVFRWNHYRKGGFGHAAAALLVFENLMSTFIVFLSASVILNFEIKQPGEAAEWLLPFAWLGTLGLAFTLLPFLHKPSAGLFRRLLQPLLKRPGRIQGMIARLLNALDSYHSMSIRKVGLIFFSSFLGHLFFLLSAWILAEGMQIAVGLTTIAWVRSITILVAMLPITVAGIGLREGTIIALLRDYSVSPSTAFAYSISSFAIQMVFGLFGAAFEALRFLKGKFQPGAITKKKESM